MPAAMDTIETPDQNARSFRPGPVAAGVIWLIGVGAWMRVSQNHLFGLTVHHSWPLFTC